MTKFTVNDRPVQYRLDPATPLLWALRDASNLTGTKYGCGNGDCGACMVVVDGEAIRSCLVSIAEVEGRYVTTIEALSRDRSHPVQQAFVAEQAVQCGFCTSGMIIAASVLLRKNSDPSDADIDSAIAQPVPVRHLSARARSDQAGRSCHAAAGNHRRSATTGHFSR